MLPMRLLKLSVAALALGILLFGAGIVAGVLAGGVPYHDGPNAGHTSPPGWRRVLEDFSGPVLLAGVSMSTLGACGTFAGLGVMLSRRRRTHRGQR
jgi:hypothetical protein